MHNTKDVELKGTAFIPKDLFVLGNTVLSGTTQAVGHVIVDTIAANVIDVTNSGGFKIRNQSTNTDFLKISNIGEVFVYRNLFVNGNVAVNGKHI